VLSGGQLSRQVAATGARFGTGVARQPRARVIGIGAAILAVVVGAGTYLLVRSGEGNGPPAPIDAGVTLPGPFRVISMTPAPGARQADGSDPVQVTFSAPVAPDSPRPTLSPSVPGSWQWTGDTLMFMPTTPFSPSTRVTVTVPAGVRSAMGRLLARPMTAKFTTRPFSSLALANLLGRLGYLPGSWQQPNPRLQVAGRLGSTDSGLARQLQLAYDPPAGSIQLAQGYPASLAGLWTPGTYNVILRGAVMAFQSQHNMTINGEVNGALWTALLRAARLGQNNVNGYTYAVTSKANPETLTIWHNGALVFHSLANTGIPSRPTVDGTFPVFERFLNTIMSGTNPDGSHYSDPVQYVSYFNGGDAVHYFPRGGYGYEQSLGCVELAYGDAKKAYPYLTYGSLVTVTG
jgi:peptidoglycan hydrolase-like protein with peptidoglycan-binding domain